MVVSPLPPSHTHIQDLLLAFVDCVERNGAMLAVPRTVLELDPSMDPDALLPAMGRMTPLGGLLPAPGGSVGGYRGRGTQYTHHCAGGLVRPSGGKGKGGRGGGEGGEAHVFLGDLRSLMYFTLR